MSKLKPKYKIGQKVYIKETNLQNYFIIDSINNGPDNGVRYSGDGPIISYDMWREENLCLNEDEKLINEIEEILKDE